uniref:Microfibril associated protein 4 n=1 Tax=Maylandia zebra TaxID=106582 RepID=A0A3P9DNG2_9CICH
QLLSVFAILHLAPLLTSSKEIIQPLDCNDIHQQDSSRPSAVHYLPFWRKVCCRGNYKIIALLSEISLPDIFSCLLTVDGSLNFYRPWNHYKMGFGNPNGDYWLGETLFFEKYELSPTAGRHEGFSGKGSVARYSSFKVDAECDGYKLTIAGFNNGGAGDGLTYHNGMKFSTFDKDQDGIYGATGMEWYPWKGWGYSMKAMSMKFRLVQ